MRFPGVLFRSVSERTIVKTCLGVWCMGAGDFRVEGRGLRVEGRGSRVEGRGLRVEGSGFRVQGPGVRVQGSGFWGQGPRFKTPISLRRRCEWRTQEHTRT